MKKLLALIGIIFLMTACGHSNSQAVAHNPCAPGQPTNVSPMQTYVAVTCDNGTVATIQVAQMQSGYNGGYSYNNNNDFIWGYLLGASFHSSPAYVHYIGSPYYRSYGYSVNHYHYYTPRSSSSGFSSSRNTYTKYGNSTYSRSGFGSSSRSSFGGGSRSGRR